MKNWQVAYYSGDVELANVWPERNKLVRERFPKMKIVRCDSFYDYVGVPNGQKDRSNFMPVTRRVFWNQQGKQHKCGPRCRSAKGHDCECECGGKNHGVDR